uniref:Chondroitin proteoglycan 4 domain-containing protein n=1 Tax=Romanomermis culicivorax TaxID=13658 RepID=A0A915KNP7_ROMCU
MVCRAIWISPESIKTDHLRFKRQSGVGRIDQCTIDCLAQMDTQFNETFGSNEEQDVLREKYDEEKFDKLCQTYTPSSECLKSCRESDFQKKILGSFDTLEFMCVTNNDDVKSYMPCIYEHKDTVDNSCDPNCKTYEQSVKKWSSMQANSHSDFSEMKQMFMDSCSYVKCESTCYQSTISSSCGEDAKVFMDHFWNSVVYSLNNATEISNELMVDKQIPGCDFSLPVEL